jgi:2'-5' RNA ligase
MNRTMQIPNAYGMSFYRKLGIDLSKLGCVMLDVDVPGYVSNSLKSDWAYVSEDPKLADGLQSEFHVTLLFGLLTNANLLKEEIREVLSGWEMPKALPCTEVGVFPSPIASEPYKCVWVKPWSPQLLEAHCRLSMLPHVDSHAGYEPHITLGYVHEKYEDIAVEGLNRLVLEQTLSVAVRGLNYGRLVD